MSEWYGAEEGEGLAPAVVVQNGSDKIRAGVTAEGTPSVEFLNLYSEGDTGWGETRVYIGEKSRRHNNTRPMQRGLVRDWYQMEAVWRHIWDDELRLVIGDEEPAEEDCCGVLMSCAPHWSNQDRERTTKMMFETFNVRRFYLSPDPALSLFATGP